MTRKDDLINEKIEGYRIATTLVSNSFRSIFLGESISPTTSHQRVVIELFYSAAVHTQREQQDILNKLSALQQVKHSHILPILAIGFHKEIPYIITEYLPSDSLYNRFQQGIGQPIHMKEAILTLAQVGQALSSAHQRQIVHGSLKPQNVLFTAQNETLVTGFHYHALLLPDDAEESARQESSIYRAPEQLPGQASEKGDQYALGCLAYALFTGSQAFTVPSARIPGTYYKTKSLISPGRMNSDLPLYIENAILKAMSREPEQRYPDIAAFLDALGIPSADGKRPNSNIFPPLPSDEDGQIVPITPFNAALPLLSDANTHEKEFSSSGSQLAYGETGASSLHNIQKSFMTRPRRTSAVILGLIAIMIICVTILVDLNLSTPAKKVATLPSIQKTSVTHSATPTGVIIPIPITHHARTPSSTTGVRVPLRTPTPRTIVPTRVPTAAPTATPAPLMVVLNGLFNNEGIGNTPGQANFDGAGFSYPANQLPSGRQITIGGVPYQFPATGPGTSDNILASGQTISLKPGNYRQAFLLTAACWGSTSGTVVINYSNGSTSTQPLTVLDWYTTPGALNTTYRYSPNGIDNNPVRIYAIPISLDSTRIANTLVLPSQQSGPSQNSRIHIFALTLLS